MTDTGKTIGLCISTPEAAKIYAKHGFAPTPTSGKAPKLSKWNSKIIAEEDVDNVFSQEDNVSLIMGNLVNNTATVDIDCPEAFHFTKFLPPTEMTHGWDKNPPSHFTYAIEGEAAVATSRHKNVDGSVMIELLGKGTAVVVPPSKHPKGGRYILNGTLNPATVNATELVCSVNKVYIAAMCLSSYPSTGSRQDFCLALSGMLIKSQFSTEEVSELISEIARVANDEEWKKRVDCVVSTALKHSKSEPIKGSTALAEIVGEAVTKKIANALPQYEPGSNQIDETVAELNLHHAVCMVGGKASVLNEYNDPAFGYHTISMSSAADLKLRYQNQRIIVGYQGGQPQFKTAAELWLEHPVRRQYDGIVFDPQKTPKGYYNLFRGFPVKAVHGDCSLYLHHIRDVICRCNEVIYDYVIRWMAHAIQYPWELPEVAIVIRGKQGTGKGTMVQYFGSLFGQHFITLLSMKQITGQFNGHLADKILVCANEAIWGGDKIGEGYLKGLITDPTMPIEYKHKDLINVRNYKRLIVTTNEDWAVPIGIDDRRYVVIDASDGYKENKKYFSAIKDQMSNGGTEALMDYLSNMDLDGFEIRNAPYSSSSFEIKLKSADSIITFLYLALSEQLPTDYNFSWQEKVTQSNFYELYKSWCTDNKSSHPHTQPSFTKKLENILPGTFVKRASKSNGMGKRPYQYHFPSKDVAKVTFEKTMKSKSDIWPDEN